jgi:hypothetical protein
VTGFCPGKPVSAFFTVDIERGTEHFKQFLSKVLAVLCVVMKIATFIDGICGCHSERVGYLATENAARKLPP